MVNPWTARFAAALVTGFLLLSFVGVYPAGAMIFPDLLKLVRVDELTPETPGDRTGEKAGSEKHLQTETYIVKTGDTLWEISRRYDVDYKVIAEANKIGDDCIIHAGQELDIPCEGTIIHVVRPGESLWQIARKYGKSVDELAKVNQVTDPKKLRVGKSLVISKGGSVPATAVSSVMPSRGSSLWKWPVIGPITQRYGGVNFHHGLDIAAETGTKIYPLRPGKVEFSGWLNRIYGRAVIIDHGNGMKTLYAHNSQNLVEEGDYVGVSSPIGKIGSTGRATGPHLHLEVHVDDKTVDPQRYLGSQPGS